MEVDFNNLRVQTGIAFERLTRILNSSITNENHFGTNKNGYELRGNMIVDASEIKNLMDTLRSDIWAINCVFEEDNEDFKLTYDEINKGEPMTVFNDEEEDEDDG